MLNHFLVGGKSDSRMWTLFMSGKGIISVLLSEKRQVPICLYSMAENLSSSKNLLSFEEVKDL